MLTSGYHPSPRVCQLRDRALAQPPELFWGYWVRAYYYLEGWMAAAGQPLPLRNACAYSQVIEQMPPQMHAGELLVGEHGFNSLDTPFHFWGTPPANLPEILAASPLTPEQQHRLIGWLDEKPFAFLSLAPVAPVPEEMERAIRAGVFVVWDTDLNHSVRGYEKVLTRGFAGLREEVDAALAALSPADPDAPHRRANLLGWQRICAAAMTLGERHAAQARMMAAHCDDAAQRRAWEEIADICTQVPAQPARTFREALQSLWFAHMLTAWEDGLNANSIGRLDQFLWPFLEADLAAGRLTWEEAAELLAACWIKLYFTYDVQQTIIGGQHTDGSDAVNPLSYLVLDITEGLGTIRCLSARLHQQSPREFIARCVDLVARGGGIPFFFNDDTIIPALVAKGIPLEEARGYAPLGCVEITIPGKASPHAVSHYLNVAKCLELALNDGRDARTGEQVGPRTGMLADFSNIQQVCDAYTEQLEYFSAWAAYGSNARELAHRAQYRLPYLSLLTDDCVSRGLDIIEGGARYNYHSSAVVGIPNVADSLTALESVFRDQAVTPAELAEALLEDFAGREDLLAYLRHRLPKYGNDDPLADDFARQVTEQYCEMMNRYRTVSGGTFFAQLFSFTAMLDFGKLTGATPEGRRAGEPLAYSVSPVQGRDRAGLTALLHSLSRLPHAQAAASSSAIVEADPTLLEGPGRAAFVDLLITAIRQGVGQLQFNVVSADTLRAAQRHPDRYRNLCVRVSGFSQQFGLLNQDMQDHIIARTKHNH